MNLGTTSKSPTSGHPLKIGTSSWKYDSWKGILYSENVGSNYLKEYARHYNTVEIDQWFWSLFPNKVVLPNDATVMDYVASVPRDFTFAIKIPNSITLTHYYQKDKAKPVNNPHFLSIDLFIDFLKSIGKMHEWLGPLMFQFEYLNKQKMPSQQDFIKQFEAFIERCPSGYTYCVETRNPNYLNKKYFEFINANKLYHVFLQGYYMPPIFPLYASHRQFIKDLTVIRLHGPDRAAIEKKTSSVWNEIVEPKDDELA
ncbi:DUF72 domain-containing protein, partial [candidate division KSB1 bacterium]|nr:DUF72 domain-containing protein [candidate division KSB1 bacterium]